VKSQTRGDSLICKTELRRITMRLPSVVVWVQILQMPLSSVGDCKTKTISFLGRTPRPDWISSIGLTTHSESFD